ncbi:MAG TPA: cyclic nucleotide-binding domain-containing protein [Candidatus Deferrimicrobiaceae bacterium]|jgi:PAS domain-containing protein
MANESLGKTYPDGEIIFRQGDAADCLYIIQSGHVVIYQEEGGTEVILAELGEGDTFGDMGVFMGPVRTESARARGDARVVTADYRFVLKKFRDDPSYAFQVIEKMARRDRARKELADKALEDETLRRKDRAAQARDADYYDFAPVGAIDLDEEGVIRGINLSGAALLGSERGELLGLPFATFVPPENIELYRKHLLACKNASEGVITELLLKTRKGNPTKVQFFSYPKQDQDRVVYRTLMTELASRQ